MVIKERIQQKAEELFRQYGIKTVTMNDIATQLGISKKTIYQYYSDKDALVKDIFETITDHNKQKCLLIKNRADNAVHEQYLSSDAAQEIFNNMNSSVLFDLNRFYPSVFTEFENHKKKFLFNVIKDNLLRGTKEGLFRKDIDINTITWLQLELISGMLRNEDVISGKISAAQFERQMKDFFLHGLCTEKGLRFVSKYKQQRQKKTA